MKNLGTSGVLNKRWNHWSQSTIGTLCKWVSSLLPSLPLCEMESGFPVVGKESWELQNICTLRRGKPSQVSTSPVHSGFCQGPACSLLLWVWTLSSRQLPAPALHTHPGSWHSCSGEAWALLRSVVEMWVRKKAGPETLHSGFALEAEHHRSGPLFVRCGIWASADPPLAPLSHSHLVQVHRPGSSPPLRGLLTAMPVPWLMCLESKTGKPSWLSPHTALFWA